LDCIRALTDKRQAKWDVLQRANFLTRNEKRQATMGLNLFSYPQANVPAPAVVSAGLAAGGIGSGSGATAAPSPPLATMGGFG